MFGSSLGRWRIGSLLGFPVEISWSFLLLLAVAMLAFGGMTAVFVTLLAFGSVLLHELGHAVVARTLGVRVSSIELGFFGGAAKMVELPRSANHEIAIAIAGPAVSLMLSGLGFGLGAVTGVALLSLIGWINLVIAGFNLLPALPMDGGRILRALLTRRMDYVRATDSAVKVARVFAIGFAVVGLFFSAFQLLVLAPVLWMMGTQERWMARALAERYIRTAGGYAQRSAGRGGAEVEVLPRGAWEVRGRGPRRPVVASPVHLERRSGLAASYRGRSLGRGGRVVAGRAGAADRGP
ncbi:MAG: site-2 protease family protein [Myxococcales bacterium]|nr:site-2 protease family protein [Myxococcales bacterium]